MNSRNRSTVSMFKLLGFSESSDIRAALFVAFLLVYIIILLGNLIIIVLITITPKLHVPMYLFLWNLACLDIASSSVTMPRMLVDLLTNQKYIAFRECMAQVFAFVFFCSTEVIVLSTMCYDRYIAISQPLQYIVIMNKRFCLLVLGASWMTGFLYSVILTIHVSQLPFCGDNVIDHFHCDIPNLMKLACANNLPNEIVILVMAGCLAMAASLVILISYAHIVRVILKIPLLEGRRKVFSTCFPNLVVICLFFGTAAGTHLKPSSRSLGQDKLASLFYTVFTPMLNPIIYCLRNEEVKTAARKVVRKVQHYTQFSASTVKRNMK
ncbi:olfactory receptor 5J3-like [Lissotriton helveticus]